MSSKYRKILIRKYLARSKSINNAIAMGIITEYRWNKNSKRYNNNHIMRFPIDKCTICERNNAKFHCHTLYYYMYGDFNQHYRCCESCVNKLNKSVYLYIFISTCFKSTNKFPNEITLYIRKLFIYLHILHIYNL
jgi:hypothetical protein